MRTEDIIDLRDIAETIADEDADPDERAEALEVRAAFIDDGLAHDADSFAEYAENEPTAIHEAYFETYAQELAEDIGAVPGRDVGWPLWCIDWERAADELKADYSAFQVDGSTYYVRAF